MREKIKAICVNKMDVDDLVLNEIYDVELHDNGFHKEWIITIEDRDNTYLFDFDYTIILPFNCFIPIAEYRNQRIDSILKDD